jgi:hypothetical protein
MRSILLTEATCICEPGALQFHSPALHPALHPGNKV